MISQTQNCLQGCGKCYCLAPSCIDIFVVVFSSHVSFTSENTQVLLWTYVVT